jgi:hypothetical protein
MLYEPVIGGDRRQTVDNMFGHWDEHLLRLLLPNRGY